MSSTTNLALPFMDANQNQKYVTFNEALLVVDALAQMEVQNATLAAPPGSPSDGQRWIVAPGATGAWTGKDLAVAAWQDGAWRFYAPRAGWIAYDAATSTLLLWGGSTWRPLVGGSASLSALGIGTAADGTNPLSATLNAALFAALATGSGGTGDVRVKVSKEAAAKTASLLFQDAFSGRAEIGLTGDDDFHVKVSPDGSTFQEGLRLDKSTGAVTLGNARTAVADASYAALTSDRLVAYTSLTAARTVTLPAASAFPAGHPLRVIDESGACNGTRTIAINRAGSDTINGTTSLVLSAAYACASLMGDGSSRWTKIG